MTLWVFIRPQMVFFSKFTWEIKPRKVSSIPLVLVPSIADFTREASIVWLFL
ncbi:hypothetical protein ACFS7Z_25470 [Pontibacter toksunensis]|uniref:Uncharacterized protein n=1 Tax=Pontibacter toksunensis TaxID=1332631 RepID=A0ABW6C3N4_9BACT